MSVTLTSHHCNGALSQTQSRPPAAQLCSHSRVWSSLNNDFPTPLSRQRQREWKAKTHIYSKEGNLQTLEELLKPQKWDPEISFIIKAQSKIPGSHSATSKLSFEHLSLWCPMGLLSILCRCFSWTLLYKYYRESLFFCLEKTQSYFCSVTSTSSKILESSSPYGPTITEAQADSSSQLHCCLNSCALVVFIFLHAGI